MSYEIYKHHLISPNSRKVHVTFVSTEEEAKNKVSQFMNNKTARERRELTKYYWGKVLQMESIPVLIDLINTHVTRKEFEAVSEHKMRLSTHKNTLLVGWLSFKFDMGCSSISKALSIRIDVVSKFRRRYRELLNTDIGSAYIMHVWSKIGDEL